MRAMQALSGLALCTVVAGALYRSPSLYHPRRHAILHLQSLRKTKKQQQDFEAKLPYLDFSPLRMRGLQVLMVATATTTLGTFVPFTLLPYQARAEKITDTSILLLMVFLGVAFAFGCLLLGLVVICSSLRCMVARRYLCQITAMGCGIVTMIFTLASGFNAFALFMWVYGLLVGGYTYSLKVYSYELVSLKLAERSWGYVVLAEVLPVLLGSPIAMYLNESSGTGRAGFLFAGICMVLGSLMLFFMPWASKHKSNHQVIQAAHLYTKTFDEDAMFLGMEVSENISSEQPNRESPYMLGWRQQRRLDMSRMRTFYHNGGIVSSQLSEDGRWSDIEAMTPMSPTDKVTDFLLHSQSMLQSYSLIHHLNLPNLRLEINNEYPPERDTTIPSRECDAITDIKLEATIFRNSIKAQPRRDTGSVQSRPGDMNTTDGEATDLELPEIRDVESDSETEAKHAPSPQTVILQTGEKQTEV